MSLKKSEDMLCLTSCICCRCCIRIQVHSVRYSQPLALLNVPQPISVILGSGIISKSAAYYNKFNVRIFNSLPVYFPLMMTYIESFFHSIGNDLSDIINKISVHFCPCIQRVCSRFLIQDQLAV